MTMPRRQLVDVDITRYYHCISRCVRRAFLCGEGYEHRKQWIEDRLELLADCFALSVCGFAVLDNHMHLLVRLDPHEAATWSDEEVVRRWIKVYPPKTLKGDEEVVNQAWIAHQLRDAKKVTAMRQRLANLGWFMKALKEPLARIANQEDGCRGTFWQSRSRAVRLLDEEALLACAAYVDLNPIRAAMAKTLEESDFTSIQRRLQTTNADRFLAPLFIDERADALGPQPSVNGYRCSDKGFLQLSLPDYVRLLEWSARQVAIDRRGTRAGEAPPILERMSIDATAWSQLALNFGRLFYHVAGRAETVDSCRSRVKQHRFYMHRKTRQILVAAA